MTRSYEEILKSVRAGFLDPILRRSHRASLESAIGLALDQLEEMQYGTPIWWSEGGEAEYESALKRGMPESTSEMNEVISYLVHFLRGIPIYGHPETVPNVVPQSTIPSIVGVVLTAICNPNIMEESYGGKVCEAEVEVASLISSLIGYDREKSSGFFTFGGTGTNLYGIKLGVQKVIGSCREKGVRRNAKVITSEVSHYSLLNVMDWLGLGTDNLVKIDSNEDNSVSLEKLEDESRRILNEGEKIACIVPTLGTTDAFGIDDIRWIVTLRNELVDDFSLDYVPHVHADSVIGWVLTVFNDYNFDENPLQLPGVEDLINLRDKIRYLYMADSAGIDFHKLGYTPYISSLFAVKKREDLELISRDKSLMPYLFYTGCYHPGIYTLETTRSGGGVLSALSNLYFLGKDGYRVLLTHAIEMTKIFRRKIKEIGAVILNEQNIGPATLFRVYPAPYKDKSTSTYEEEMGGDIELLRRCNTYNEDIFRKIDEQIRSKGVGIVFSMTKSYKETLYGEDITALKAYMTSPHIEEENIDHIVQQISRAMK
jgi:glutamate/tyrosine decarboxylase-like PLP-dependent enzyme